MDEWMHEYMDGWTNRWKNDRMDVNKIDGQNEHGASRRGEEPERHNEKRLDTVTG